MQRSLSKRTKTKQATTTIPSPKTTKSSPRQPQRKSPQTTSIRTFAGYYDTGSAVSTPRARGPKTQPKSSKSNPSQSRYDMLRSTQNSQQPQQKRSPQGSGGQSDPTRQQPRHNQQQHSQSGNNPPPSRTEAAATDFDSVFKNSKLSHIFSGTPTHESFWHRMSDGDTVYLVGTRRLVDPHGTAQDNNFCLLQRTVDKQMNQIHDRLVALDYESGMPFEQYLTTTIDENLSNATAIDKDQETGTIISRTFLRLRGEGWKWHSGVAMSKIEPRVPATMSQEFLESLPETFAISRMKFGENGILAEKLIKQNNKIVLTIVDDLKITTKALFQQKAEKIFNDYSKMLAEQLEKNAEKFDGDEGGAGDNDIDTNMFQQGGGGGMRPM